MATELDAIKQLLQSRAWRLDNLYLILDESAQTLPYHPRAEQLEFRKRRHNRNFVPKARKLGISTEIVLENLDEALFTPNFTVGIIDFKEDDAFAKLQIARFAWEQGPNHPNKGVAAVWQALHKANPVVRDNDGEMCWHNGSKIEAGTSFTGRTPQRLHWSEAGPLSAQAPERAATIKRGTLNSVPPDGIVDVETTMEGGRVGVAYGLFSEAKAAAGRDDDLSMLEWRLHFFPWINHPSYILPGRVPLNGRTEKYFREIQEKHGVTVPLDRQAWYEAKQREQGDDMLQQFPTVVSEVDMAVILGAIYPDMTRVRAEGRVRAFNIEPHLPLYGCWDAGGDTLAGWLIQPTRKDINIVDCFLSEGGGAAGLVKATRAWEAKYGPIAKTLVPHDVEQKDKGSAKTFKAQMIESGLQAHLISVVPRIPDVWVGINEVRSRLHLMWFHSRCDEPFPSAQGDLPSGVARLESYRKAFNRTMHTFLDYPLKDGICDHAADGLRTFAEADAQGLVFAPAAGERTVDIYAHPHSDPYAGWGNG